MICVKYHQSVIDNARESTKQQPGRPLAIALDTVSHDLSSKEQYWALQALIRISERT